LFKVGILTVSDSSYKGLREDTGGPLISDYLKNTGQFEVECREICPDEEGKICEILVKWVDECGLDLIFTTGGTGLSPRDVTPEATYKVIERLVPGISEAIRAFGLKKTSRAMLSRGIAGVRAGCLIINLPGSPKAVQDGLEAVADVLVHAILKLQGDTRPCGDS